MSPLSFLSSAAQRQASIFSGSLGDQIGSTAGAQSPAKPDLTGVDTFSRLQDSANAQEPSFRIQATAQPDRMDYQPSTFGHLMQQMVGDVNNRQVTAGDKVRDVLAGGNTPVHEAMIAVEEAGLSFRMLSEMRNKLLDAYQEIMRMQI